MAARRVSEAASNPQCSHTTYATRGQGGSVPGGQLVAELDGARRVVPHVPVPVRRQLLQAGPQLRGQHRGLQLWGGRWA